MYADSMTNSMKRTIDETNRRREKQMKYNEDMGITPTQIQKSTRPLLAEIHGKTGKKAYQEPLRPDVAADPVIRYMDQAGLLKAVEKTRKSMEKAAKELDFIEAARLRDEMFEMEKILNKKA
jgi:excinuclease ABC subunit B